MPASCGGPTRERMFIRFVIVLNLSLIACSSLAEAKLLAPSVHQFSNATITSSNQESGVIATNNDESSCVEDRIEAIEMGRQCSRRCKREVPCENARKQCLCDGLCGMSCLKPDLNCIELPRIEHGDYQPKSARFNVRVVYECDPGYYLFGSRERLCQGDEDWSGTPAECMPEPQCRNPIKVNHAKNPSDGTYRLNDRVNYSCYPGYQSRGSSLAVCKLIKWNQTAWAWSGDPFRCIPKSCGDPGHIDNGKRHGDSFIVASSVLYTCNEGYEMIGQARRYCQSDGLWSGQAAVCEPVTCNPTEHLENGRINYAAPLVFNSTVEYACDFGFKLLGPQRRKCGPERKLVGPVPTCKEIDCGEIGPLYNGFIRGYSTRMGDKKEFYCHEGMKFVGEHNESVCLDSGQWSHPLPQCLGPCPVPRVEHAVHTYVIEPDLLLSNGTTMTTTTTTTSDNTTTTEITLEEAKVDSLASHGSILEIVCKKEYEFEERMDDQNLIHAPYCLNSTWSHEPRCEPASCHSTPPSPRNGRVRVVGIEHGSKGFIHCLDGFRLKGDNVTECIRGQWTQVNSSCAEIYCSFPGSIDHGRVLLVGLTGMYDYKPYIKRISTNRQVAYECDSGYRLNDGAHNGATCMDGQWKPDGLPTCIKE